MSEDNNTNGNYERRERASSGWQSASEHRSYDRNRSDRAGARDDSRGGYRSDRNDRDGGFRGGRDNDRRDGGYRGGRDNGGYRSDRNDRDGGHRGGRDNYRDDRGGAYRAERNERDSRFRDQGFGGRPRDPQIPETVSADDLNKESRNHLKALTKDTADQVARHLVYAGAMMDTNPELAYEHAQAAYRHAARIDIVREALGLAAYLNGRYSEALRELRTYRRMTDDYSHVAIEADSERGLGRAEKALAFIAEIPLKKLDPEAQIELALVTSGARADNGDSEGGLSVLEKLAVENLSEDLRARVELIRADRLEELGREDEAAALRSQWEPVFDEEGEVDLIEEEIDEEDDDFGDSEIDESENDEESDDEDFDEDEDTVDPDDECAAELAAFEAEEEGLYVESDDDDDEEELDDLEEDAE